MQQQEDVPQSALIDANIQSLEEGVPLDEATVAKIAQNMETLDLNNEDGALYSVYLKIEEKRIWKRIKEELDQYCNESQSQSVDNSKYQMTSIIKELDTFILQSNGGGFSYGILDYMVSEIKELDIENYTERRKDPDNPNKSDKPSIKECDFQLIKIINSKPDIPNRKQILAFLYARIGSLGQLSYKSRLQNHGCVLRELVANTDFKDSDNTESKEFLLLVSKIEKEYVEKKYKEISEIQIQKKPEEKDFKQRMEVGYTPIVHQDQINPADQVKEHIISDEHSIENL
ncbi:MAG: hypothetical protein J6A04_04790 [Clostridia bacterium]|nr:hypothetical protein [Clostridia bacterium]